MALVLQWYDEDDGEWVSEFIGELRTNLAKNLVCAIGKLSDHTDNYRFEDEHGDVYELREGISYLISLLQGRILQGHYTLFSYTSGVWGPVSTVTRTDIWLNLLSWGDRPAADRQFNYRLQNISTEVIHTDELLCIISYVLAQDPHLQNLISAPTSQSGFVSEYQNRLGVWQPSRAGTNRCLRTLIEATLVQTRNFPSEYRIRNLDTGDVVVTCHQGTSSILPDTITYLVTTTNQEPEIMPTIEIDPETRTPEMMARIAITRDKATNRLLLTIDAKPLHDLLDSIGCAVDSNNMYKDRPAASFATVDRQSISTEALLKRVYPNVISLSGVFAQPPSIDQLRNLCSSAHNQIRTILQHYQPIDISVTINKRVIGG